jgi:hypothetical protein
MHAARAERQLLDDENADERARQGAAILCWHHLYRWPAVRAAARDARARGEIRIADLLILAADRAQPWSDRQAIASGFS